MSMVALVTPAGDGHATETARDPRFPFTPGGPATDLPITDDDLDRALAHLLAHYPDQESLMRAANKARGALKRSADEDPEEPRWIVEAAGVFHVLGSSGYYTVTDSECYKRGVSVVKKKGSGRTRAYCKGWIHAGQMCYHVVARELVRLAQVLTYGTETATADDYHTFIAEAGAERAIVFVPIAGVVAAIEGLLAHGASQMLTLDWNEADNKLMLRYGTASTSIQGYGNGMAALNVDPHAVLRQLMPVMNVEDEPECALRFGTAPVATIITSQMTKNLRGAHLV